MEVLIRKLSDAEIADYRIYSWPIWTKEVSVFEWYYDATEECYLIKGLVEVTNARGEKIMIQGGDFVTFPQGLACTWKVIEPVKKHYRFG